MAKSGEQVYADVQTPEQLASALRKRLASGELSPTAEMQAVKLIAQLEGWIGGKTPKPVAESPATVKPPTEEPPW